MILQVSWDGHARPNESAAAGSRRSSLNRLPAAQRGEERSNGDLREPSSEAPSYERSEHCAIPGDV